MKKQIIHYPDDKNTTYHAASAAYIACVCLDFLILCARRELISTQKTSPGSFGIRWSEIQRLAVIRRLHEDLHVDLDALEIILHLRQRLEKMLDQRRALEEKILRQQAEIDQYQKKLKRLRHTGMIEVQDRK